MTPRSRAGRPLTDAEIRQRTKAGRKSHEDSTTPTGVLSFSVGHYSQPGVNDGQVRLLFRPGSALVARLNANPPPCHATAAASGRTASTRSPKREMC